jgi:hypothetical protein
LFGGSGNRKIRKCTISQFKSRNREILNPNPVGIEIYDFGFELRNRAFSKFHDSPTALHVRGAVRLPDIVSNRFNGQAFAVHFLRFERNILTKVTDVSMRVCKAVEIVLVSKLLALHAAAEARQFDQDLGYFLRSLISGAGFTRELRRIQSRNQFDRTFVSVELVGNAASL